MTDDADAPGTGGSGRYRLPRRMSGLARTMERMLDALGYEQVDLLGVSFGGTLAQQLAHQAPQRIRRLVLAATGTSVPWLHRLRQQTLVLSGDDDPIVPLVNGRILNRLIPDSRLHVVRGGGHLLLLEQPDEMAALATQFLSG